MAHECPDCGLICHCHGDIDDICLNDEAAICECRHCECPECGLLKSDCRCEDWGHEYDDEIL